MTIEDCDKAIANLQHLRKGGLVEFNHWPLTLSEWHWTAICIVKIIPIPAPPQEIEAHGRTYELKPIPEPRKPREWLLQVSPSGALATNEYPRPTWNQITVIEKVEDVNK